MNSNARAQLVFKSILDGRRVVLQTVFKEGQQYVQ